MNINSFCLPINLIECIKHIISILKLYTMGFLFFFILFICICFIVGWNTLGAILIILTVVLIIFVFSSTQSENEKDAELKKRNQEIKVKREENIQNVIIPAYNDSYAALLKKYGQPTKKISLALYDLNKDIIAFEESSRIWICGNDLQMKNIISCTFTDDMKIVKGKITSTTQTKNGNMVKRAVVGDVLLGGAGAIIGGSTAAKSTITTQENDKVYHNYTVLVNVDSLSDPIIYIQIGDNGTKLNEIIGLFNVIVKRN